MYGSIDPQGTKSSPCRKAASQTRARNRPYGNLETYPPKHVLPLAARKRGAQPSSADVRLHLNCYGGGAYNHHEPRQRASIKHPSPAGRLPTLPARRVGRRRPLVIIRPMMDPKNKVSPYVYKLCLVILLHMPTRNSAIGKHTRQKHWHLVRSRPVTGKLTCVSSFWR